MSAVSDKARFYLEQSVPQLQEFEEKKIFSKEEIRTLVKKRTDFEHKVLARGVQPVDFAKYAAWEISLDNLRAKRCRRLRIKGSTNHTGQARVFSIFERGTKRHPGDLDLWMSYLQYAKDVHAIKRFKNVMTAAVRMHPTKSDLWLYGAKWALEVESDMSGARSYMQRGMRFCTADRILWIEYAKLEMIYLAKIYLRRQILGLEKSPQSEDNEEEPTGDDFQTSKDTIVIPEFGSIRPQVTDGMKVDSDAKNDPTTTPALQGAIPLAIYDSASKQSFFTPSTAEAFFDMFSLFHQVPCLARIIQHVVDSLMEKYPAEAAANSCFIRQPLIGIQPTSTKFPEALSATLDRLGPSLERINDLESFEKRTKAWVEPILAQGGLDEGVEIVLRHILRKVEKR